MNKLVYVLGASGGIGIEITKKLLDNDYFVVAFGRDEKKIKKQLPKHFENKWTFRHLDFMDLEKTEHICKEVISLYPNPYAVVNCVGIGDFGSFLEVTPSEVKKVFNINVLGPIVFLKEIIKNMNNRQAGIVINIESVASLKAFENGALYISSKHALTGFSDALRMEFKKSEIQICSIKPGLVDTNFFGSISSEYDISVALSPKDVAFAVFMVLQQSQTSNITNIEIHPKKRKAQNLFQKMINKEKI